MWSLLGDDDSAGTGQTPDTGTGGGTATGGTGNPDTGTGGGTLGFMPLQAADIFDAVTLYRDCEASPQDCCVEGLEFVELTSSRDVYFSTGSAECVAAGEGDDVVFLQSSSPAALLLGAGNDTAMDGPQNDLIISGSGNDTINGYGGTNVFLAGAGNDTVTAANGDNIVVPGPGADTVSLGTGDDHVYIFDACEVEWGERLAGGTGHDVLHTPLSLEELAAKGVTVHSFEEIIIESQPCRSECARPSCGDNGTCTQKNGEASCSCESGWAGDDCQTEFDGIPVDSAAGVAPSVIAAFSKYNGENVRYVSPHDPFPEHSGLPPGVILPVALGGSDSGGDSGGVQDSAPCNQHYAPKNSIFRVTKFVGGTDGVANPNTEAAIVLTIEPNLRIRQYVGNDCSGQTCPSAELDFSLHTTPTTVAQLHIDILESDPGPSKYDDDELDIDLTLDVATGQGVGSWRSIRGGDSGNIPAGTTCVKTKRGFEICWQIESFVRPRFCPSITAEYLDSGVGESVLPNRGKQLVNAPFAMSKVVIHSGAEMLGCFEGYLDKDGCIPEGKDFPAHFYDDQEISGKPLTITTEVFAILCKDSTGQDCSCDKTADPNCKDPGAKFHIGRGQLYPEKTGEVIVPRLCRTRSEDPSFSVADHCKEVSDLSPPVVAQQVNEVIGINSAESAIIGLVGSLLAEEANGKELEIENSFSKSGRPYEIYVENFCGESLKKGTASTMDDWMCLQPARDGGVSDSQYKYIAAHELGHVVMGRFGPNTYPQGDGTSYNYEGSSFWGCRHIDILLDGNNEHCMQGIEYSQKAQSEGFAQYFAAKALNPTDGSSCAYNYAKAMLMNSCVPGAGSCNEIAPGQFYNAAPVPLDCNSGPIKHRNADPNLNGRIAIAPWEASTGTEWDWMLFYRALDVELNWTIAQIFEVYTNAYSQYGVSFDGAPVVPAANRRGPASSLVDSVNTVMGSFASQQFSDFGDKYGVSRETTPR